MKNKLIPTFLLTVASTFLLTQKANAQYSGGDGSGAASKTTKAHDQYLQKDSVPQQKGKVVVYGSNQYQFSEAIAGGMVPNTPYSFSHYRYVEKNSTDTTYELFAGNTMGQGFLSKIVKGKKGYNISLADNGPLADYIESSGNANEAELRQAMETIATIGVKDPKAAQKIFQQLTDWRVGDAKFSTANYIKFAKSLDPQ